MSNYDKVVKLATKPKIAAPKPKYVDVLITASYSEDASLNDIIRSLANRLREPMTIVVFKSLVVLHTLVRHGSIDPVLSHLVSNASLLRLKHIASIDTSSTYTPPRSLTVYAQYIDTRVRAYRELRRDVIRAPDNRNTASTNSSGLSGGQRLRRLKVEKGLLREINITQKVMNAVLACSFFLDDPSDEITLAAFRMALKDLLDLYAAVNEGIINMLEHYFEMSKVDATAALKIYREFCNQTEKVVAYLTAARKYSHALRVAIPQLKHAPVSLAGALEEYLNDPNFEENRVEYRKNRQIADGETKKDAKKDKEGEKKKKEEGDGKEEGKKEEKKKAESKPPIPSSNQALQDFFASIDTDQHTMTFSSSQQQFPQQQQAMFTGAPTMFGMGMQPTGMMLAPPQQQQQQQMMMAAGLAPQMTGFNPFLQPNMTGMNPAFAVPQQQQQNAFLQAQMTGMNAFGGGGGGQMQPQMTGVNNPFRPQSVFMPSSAAGMGMSADLTGFNGAGGAGMMMNSAGNGNGNAFGGSGSASGSSIGGASSPSMGSSSRLQPISENGVSTPATSTASLSAAPAGRTTLSPSPATVSKPLMPQKTGSRNPFAPPPGEVQPQAPVQKAAGPSLFELAASGVQGQANGMGAAVGALPPQQQQQQLVPQKTGLIGDVASEFTSAGASAGNRAVSPAVSTSALPADASTDGGLSAGFGNFSLGGGGGASTSSALAPQATGYGGSAIKPFQPTSSFGQTLSSQVTGMPSTSSLGVGGLGGVAGGLAPNMTGNPFARSLSPAPGTSGAGGGGGMGQSLFGSGATNGAAATNGIGTSSSPAPGAGSFGASLFRSGTITQNSNGGTASNPFPSLAAQPTGAFLSSFTSGLSSVNGGGGVPSQLLQAQPTGLGGSSIKPFQPSSAFGTAAFGGLTADAQQQKNQQQQQSLF